MHMESSLDTSHTLPLSSINEKLIPKNDPFAYLAGHVGHLTAKQQEALDMFRDNLIRSGLYTPRDESRGVQASHDDPTLLRFLRARGFSPAAGQKQFSESEAWRKKHDVDKLYAEFDTDEFEDAKRFFPRWTGRRDMHGLPLYVYQISALVPIQKELDSVPAQRRYQRMIVLCELMVRFSFPLCSYLPHPSQETPISSTTTIIDLGNISLTSLWSLRNHLQMASRLTTANYPETIGRIVIINSPSFFPTVWGWIKNWFDEGTRNKIYILGKNASSMLRELIHPQDLPKVYGGELEWTFIDEPSLDEYALKVLSTSGDRSGMPWGPTRFSEGEARKPTVTQ